MDQLDKLITVALVLIGLFALGFLLYGCYLVVAGQ